MVFKKIRPTIYIPNSIYEDIVERAKEKNECVGNYITGLVARGYQTTVNMENTWGKDLAAIAFGEEIE